MSPATSTPGATKAGVDLSRTPSDFGETNEERRPLGVYVHFPWCLNKCPYCDFLSVAETRERIPHALYAEAVLAEIAARRAWVGERRLASIFFGGGTPSLWDPRELGRVLAAVRDAWPSTGPVEVTVECNPSSFDADRAHALADVGVTRVSVGIQSLDRDRLAFLGRLHDADGGLRALDAALESSRLRVNADLITGVAGQTPAGAAHEAATVAARGPTHVSVYALTIEPGTQFGALARKGRLPLLDEDLVAESILAVNGELERRGFEHYEISNFARDGHYAEHNLVYWRGGDYLGLGTGAWGTVSVNGERLRYRNTPVPDRYLASQAEWPAVAFDRLSPLVREIEPLDATTALSERLMLGLRLAEGVDVDAAGRDLGVNPWTADRRRAVARLLDSGRLERIGSRLRVAEGHWLFADAIIRDVM